MATDSQDPKIIVEVGVDADESSLSKAEKGIASLTNETEKLTKAQKKAIVEQRKLDDSLKKDAAAYANLSKSAKKSAETLDKLAASRKNLSSAGKGGGFASAAAEIEGQIAAMNKVGGELSGEKISKLRVELGLLGEKAKAAGISEEELAKRTAHLNASLDKTEKKAHLVQVEMVKYQDKLRGAVKGQTLGNQLFDQGAGKLGQLAGAATTVGAAFAGGFRAGLSLAEKAGINTEAVNELVAKSIEDIAVALDTTINKIGEFGAESAAVLDKMGAWETVKATLATMAGDQTAFARATTEASIAVAKEGSVYADLAEGFRKNIEDHKTNREEAKKDEDAQKKLAEQMSLLGVVTKEQATKNAKEFFAALAKVGDRSKLSATETDNLIEKYRELVEQGATFDGTAKKLVDSFGLLRKTTKEVADETKKLEEAQKSNASEFLSAMNSADSFAAKIERVNEKRKESARLATVAASNQLKLNGVTESGLATFEAAVEKEIQLSGLSKEERLAAEIELHDQVAKMRQGGLDLTEKSSAREVAFFKAKVEEILADAKLSEEQRVAIHKWAENEIKGASEESAAARRQAEMMVAMSRTSAIAGVAQNIIGAFGSEQDAAEASIWVNALNAGIGAYSALASIPYVGPAMGIAAAAAAYKAGRDAQKEAAAVAPPKPPPVSSPSFDDGPNDAIARQAGRSDAAQTIARLQGSTSAGRQSARDMVALHSSGFREGLAGLGRSRPGLALPAAMAVESSRGSAAAPGLDSAGLAKAIGAEVGRHLSKIKPVSIDKIVTSPLDGGASAKRKIAKATRDANHSYLTRKTGGR